VIAYIMKKCGWSLDKTLQFVHLFLILLPGSRPAIIIIENNTEMGVAK